MNGAVTTSKDANDEDIKSWDLNNWNMKKEDIKGLNLSNLADKQEFENNKQATNEIENDR